jgi:tetratricopeptide (TPR) repeat protein
LWLDPVALFEDNAAKSPGKARVHANLGKAYLDRGRHQEARRSFERALQLDPNLVGAYNNLAVIHLDHEHDPTRARSVLEVALARDPRHVESLANMGVLLLRLRRPAEALPFLKQAVELEPTSPVGLYNLGAAYINLGRHDQAAEVLLRGAAVWPRDARFLALLGLAYYEKQDRARAEVAFREALRIDPGEPMARVYLERLEKGS